MDKSYGMVQLSTIKKRFEYETILDNVNNQKSNSCSCWHEGCKGFLRTYSTIPSKSSNCSLLDSSTVLIRFELDCADPINSMNFSNSSWVDTGTA
mgnify:CR=1 FL=1